MTTKELLAAVALGTGCIVTVLALFIPPQGEVDQTVLIALGQFLVFAATLLGVADMKERLQSVLKDPPPEVRGRR